MQNFVILSAVYIHVGLHIFITFILYCCSDFFFFLFALIDHEIRKEFSTSVVVVFKLPFSQEFFFVVWSALLDITDCFL